MSNEPEPISCAAGCKRSVPDPLQAGWTYLEITGRYRCPTCDRELIAVNQPRSET